MKRVTSMRVLTIVIVLSTILTACNTTTPTSQPRSTSISSATAAPRPTFASGETPAPTNNPVSGVIRDPVTEADQADAQLVESTDLPIGDLRQLAIKLKGLPANTPDHICTTPPPEYQVGDQLSFHVSNNQTFEQFDVTATLISKEEHVYMWVDNQWLDQVDQQSVIDAGKTFNDKIYPRDRQLYGSEWAPGIDCDPHLYVLHTSNTAAGGYFSSADQYTPVVRKDSNAHEMFYIDLEGIGGSQNVGDSFYLGVLAHEFQHMIHFHIDRNEDTWANEGLSDLAMFLNGYDIGGADQEFAFAPDTQLNFWPEGGGQGVNYGAAFTFWQYFYDKYGEKGITDLVADQLNGLDGVAQALKQVGYDGTLDDFFADWVVAKYLNKPKLGDGRYGFAKSDPPLAETENTISSYPFDDQNSVHQYAAKYFPFKGSQDITLNFTGSTKAQMISTQPHSGQFFMWSNRGDSTDLAMTHEFDLTGVKNATLKYSAWYSLEDLWDYGYINVSTDGGQTWKILKTPSGTDKDPNNNSFGWGYTGASGGNKSDPVWLSESVDLSAYAGQKILVGIEVVNDLAVNLPGLAIDDVEIPEINYKSNFETDDGGWQTAGWLRTNNFVPEKFIVQLINFGKDGSTTVTRLPINDDNTGKWDIPLSTLKQAVVAISATAPKSSETSNFQWSVQEK